MKQYKIHIPYINAAGQYVGAGVYPENQLDLGEARYKSLVTLESNDVVLESIPDPDALKVFEASTNDPTAVKDLKMEPLKKTLKVKAIKINTASESDIEAIKYVGKKCAKKVIECREEAKFTSYVELNEKVPLGFNRKWEDIVAVDFDYSPPTITNNAYTVESV